MAEYHATAVPRPVEQRPVEHDTPRLEFPGCRAVRITRAEITECERRIEYWDAATETAWICEPTTSYHERPARLLTRLAEVIARVRGSHVECFGSMDLLLRDEHGEPQRIMQADESLYLHPAHARLPGRAMVVGEHDFPDVVLEVDHTTDARRGKLTLYESWGFPEVWVDVPDAPSPSRPRARRPGLTIHLLEDGCYRVAAQSRAFPGWTAAEIHEAPSRRRAPAQCWSGWANGSAHGREPVRTTTRCCVRNGAGGSSAAERKATRKGSSQACAEPARRWSGSYCCRAVSRFRRRSRPTRRSPPRPRTC